MFPTHPVPSSPTTDARPTLQDHRTVPAGILPRHLQTWVILGIAVLMTGIIAISGGSRPVDHKPTAWPGAAALAASDARIQEYRTRIDEEARRLTAAQADLDVAKRSIAAAPDPTASSTPIAGSSVRAPSQNTLQHEQAERAYRALFADNVAFSLRQGRPSTAPTTPAGIAPASAAATRTGTARSTRELSTPPSQTSTPTTAAVSSAPQAVEPVPAEVADSTIRRYPVREGTILEAVLTNRLDGSFAGPVNGMVTTAVYAPDRQHVLIPQGARLLGEAKAVASFGQQRLAVAFHRLVMPDGDSVTLDQFKGLSQAGETGLQDQVNHHYAQLFGASLAIAAVGGLAQADSRVGLDATGADLYRQGVASSSAQSSLHTLDRFLNVLPTVTIREGQRLKVYLSGDLELPAYGGTHD